MHTCSCVNFDVIMPQALMVLLTSVIVPVKVSRIATYKYVFSVTGLYISGNSSISLSYVAICKSCE